MHPKRLPEEMKDLHFQFERFIAANMKNTLEFETEPLVEQIIKFGVLIDCFGFDPKQKDRWTKAD
jgi:hypothetical protein